jgi:transposase
MLVDLNNVRIYIKPGETSFTKYINGLAEIVQNEMKLDAFSGSLFLFCNKARNRLRILYWDRNGFCLWMKRLENDKFPWPKDESGIKELSKHELSMLLDGIDFFNAHKILQFKSVG